MLMPTLWNDNFFDNFMNDFPTNRFFVKSDADLMKTDVQETDNGYKVEIDLPGFNKEDVNASLENGYLTVSASRSSDDGDKDKDGKYIRRERYQGNCSRSYYVGDKLTEDDIKAKFDNGILTLEIPKVDQKKVEQKKAIAIEG